MHRCGAVAIYGDGTRFYGTQLFDTNCGEIAGSTGALYNQSMDNFALVNAFRMGEGESKIEWDEHLYEMAMNWSTVMYYEQRLYHSDYNIAENVASAYVYRAAQNTFFQS